MRAGEEALESRPDLRRTRLALIGAAVVTVVSCVAAGAYWMYRANRIDENAAAADVATSASGGAVVPQFGLDATPSLAPFVVLLVVASAALFTAVAAAAVLRLRAPGDGPQR